jgi:hypothetical protein
MSMMNQDDQPQTGGTGRFLLIGLAALVLVGVIVAVVMMATRKASEPAPAATARTETPAPVAAPKPAEPATAAAPAAPPPRPKREKPVEGAPAPPPPAGSALVVESDVPGASVFVDRTYLGTTPLRTTAVAAGTHQLNASVTGEEGLAQSIEIGESGDTTVVLKFKEVRLNASVAVVHKHGVGACQGHLVATTEGLRYETSNTKDAFALPFSSVEKFEIDYLKKELKVKQRGGKSWNFTDRSENADQLFVFHRDVTKAREKLAAQGK